MSPDAASTMPTKLDPLGSIIYYLCVTQAIKQGTYDVPSAQTISLMLKLTDGKTGKPTNSQVAQLWNDLQWMNREKLLFHEQQPNDSKYSASFVPHPLSAHNVNIRIENFHPGFTRVTSKHRCIVPAEF